MRYQITFDGNESFVTIRTAGELDVEGHQLLLRELIDHPKWRAGMSALVDHRAATLANVTLHDMQIVSLLVRQLKNYLGSGGRCAIVLSDDAEFTKVAMWKIITAPEVGFTIEFFGSIEDAGKWLHGSPPAAED
jgi:hypothetical protein